MRLELERAKTGLHRLVGRTENDGRKKILLINSLFRALALILLE